ncbi:MAG: hypothetical protein JSW07_22355 [bacterium]|nr:MAG: hypothetical protein JSW07_22355 [bacterium]
MKKVNNDQIEKLLEDIALIKNTISRSKPVLYKILNLGVFRWFLLTVGFCIIGFSMLIFFLMQYYGSFGAIPDTLKYTIYAAIAVAGVIQQIWKGRAYSVSVRQFDRNLTLGWLLKEFYSNKISLIYVSHVILMIFLSIFFIHRHIAYFIIPTISLITALISISYGVILQIRYALAVGYWLFISGIITLIFSSMPAPIALSITFGCGMLILSFSGFLDFKSKKED